MSRGLVIAIAVTTLGGCGKKSKPTVTHDDAAVAAVHAPEAPTLPSDAAVESPSSGAPIASHVTPGPPLSTTFAHYCVKIPDGLSQCVMSEAECKALASRMSSRCGLTTSVFCFAEPRGPQCFESAEDCKMAHDNALHRSETVTGDCAEDKIEAKM